MAKLYLVWNEGKSECVGFLDEGDANFTATGNTRYLDHPAAHPTIGDSFRECYGEDVPRLPQTTVDLPE